MRVALGRPVSHHGATPADNSRAVTVRSRSAIVVSKNGKLQYGSSCASSRRSTSENPVRGGHPPSWNVTRQRVDGISAARGEDQRPLSENTRHHDGRIGVKTIVEQTRSPPMPRTAALARQESTLVTKRPEDESSRTLPAAKNGDENGSTRYASIERDEKRTLKKQRQRKQDKGALVSLRGQADENHGPNSESSEEVLGPTPVSSVSGSLLRARAWLAKNEPELDRCLHAGSAQAVRDSKSQSSPETNESSPTIAVARGKRTTVLEQTTADVSRGLRGKAAAEWEVSEARRREDEEVTGKPEITRLGRSKQRSVNDLFLYKYNVEASRRRRQHDREIMEENLLTGQPVRVANHTEASIIARPKVLETLDAQCGTIFVYTNRLESATTGIPTPTFVHAHHADPPCPSILNVLMSLFTHRFVYSKPALDPRL